MFSFLSSTSNNHPINISLEKSLLSKIKIIGHRGCTNEDGILENTLFAFKHSVKNKCDAIEFDIHLTKDGNVVVFHDETFDRMCENNFSGQKYISECLFKDLPNLKIPENNNNNESSKYSEKEFKERFSIPLLEDVLKIIPSEICIIVEFKQNNPELIKKTHNLLTKYKRIENKTVIWFCEHEKTNKLLRKFDPKIPTVSSVLEIVKTTILFHFGFLPFFPLSYHAIFIPGQKIDGMYVKDIFRNLPMWICEILAIAFEIFLVNAKMNDHLRKRGIGVWFLEINNEQNYQNAINGHATALVCDFPKLIIQKRSQQSIKNRNSVNNQDDLKQIFF